jgi:hypothetical protein
MNIFTFLQVRLQQILFAYTEVKDSKQSTLETSVLTMLLQDSKKKSVIHQYFKYK